MPSQQIVNPTGAFAPYFAQQSPAGWLYEEYIAATAISAGMAVFAATAATSVSNPQGYTVSPGTTAAAASVIGVAIDAAATAGNTIRVCTKGVIGALAASAITATSIGSPGPTGQIAAAAATIGSNICFVLLGNTAAGAITVYVNKM